MSLVLPVIFFILLVKQWIFSKGIERTLNFGGQTESKATLMLISFTSFKLKTGKAKCPADPLNSYTPRFLQIRLCSLKQSCVQLMFFISQIILINTFTTVQQYINQNLLVYSEIYNKISGAKKFFVLMSEIQIQNIVF